LGGLTKNLWSNQQRKKVNDSTPHQTRHSVQEVMMLYKPTAAAAAAATGGTVSFDDEK